MAGSVATVEPSRVTRYEATATLSLARIQPRLTLGSLSTVAPSEPGVPGAMPSVTRTLTPPLPIDWVVNEIVETGSVIDRPTRSGASLRSVVAGVESRSSVARGEPVGLAVPQPSRIVAPLTAGEPAAKLSNEPYGCGRRGRRSSRCRAESAPA